MIDSNIFWVFITILSSLIDWYVLKFIYDEASNRKRNKLFLNLILLIPISFTALLTLIGLNPILKLAIVFGISCTIYKLNYEVNILKSLFISLFYFMILAGIDVLSSNLVILLNKISNVNILLGDNIFRLENILISKSLLLLFIPVIKGIKLSVEISKKEYFLIIIPIIANILSIVSIIGLLFTIKTISYSQIILTFLVSCVLIISSASLILIISYIIKRYDKKVKDNIVIIKERLDFKYYLQLQRTQLNILYKTKNLILDVILSEKKLICDDNKIDLSVDIDFSKCNFIETVDVCNIFTNLLDNSIEQCEKVKLKNSPRRINLAAKKVCKYFVIKCECSKSYKVINNENLIIIDKDSPPAINLCAIKKSLNKYNGDIVIDHSENEFTTTILIPLKRKKNTVDSENI